MDPYLVQRVICVLYNINCTTGYNINIKIKIIEIYLGYTSILENILNIDNFTILKSVKSINNILKLYIIRFQD
jgi:hypothetical protein